MGVLNPRPGAGEKLTPGRRIDAKVYFGGKAGPRPAIVRAGQEAPFVQDRQLLSMMTSPKNQAQNEIPRSHAPRLTTRGMVVLIAILALHVAAFLFANLFPGAFGVFLAAAAAFSLSAYSAAYAASLVTWRKARFGALDHALSNDITRFRLAPGQPVPLRFELRNSLSEPANIRKLTFISTSHLRIEPVTRLGLKARTTASLKPDARLAKRGPASIYAISAELVGAAGLFVSDLVVVHQFDLDFLADSAALSKTRFPRRRDANGEPEFDTIRPYLRGDALNRIFWRGFAKTGDLFTRVFTPQQTARHIAVLIDATPAMTHSDDGSSSLLFELLPEIKALSLSADEVTHVLCTHDTCRVLTRRARPSLTLETLDDVCLKAHLFRAPQSGWAPVVQALWFDIAFAHGLDFSFTIDNRVMIDTRAMLQWMRAELVQTHTALSQHLIKAPDTEIASLYIRERRLEIEFPMDDNKPNFMLAIKRISTFRADIRPQEVWIAGRSGIFIHDSKKG